jgi:hypothetical protein
MRQGEPEQKFYAAFGTIFRISNSFKETSRNFLIFSSLRRQTYFYRSSDLILLKKYPSGEPISLIPGFPVRVGEGGGRAEPGIRQLSPPQQFSVPH